MAVLVNKVATHIASYRIVLCRIASYRITSYRIVSYWIIFYEFDCAKAAVLCSWFLKVSQGTVIVRDVSYLEAPGIKLCSFADDVLLPLPLERFAAAGSEWVPQTLSPWFSARNWCVAQIQVGL